MKNPNETAKLALKMLMDAGADEAGAAATESELNEFNADTGEFSLMRTTFDKSVSLVFIKDHKRGAVSLNDDSPEALKAAVEECVTAAHSGEPDEAWGLAKDAQDKVFQSGTDMDVEKLFMRTEELLKTIKSEYPKIMVDQLIVSHVHVKSAYANSHAVHYEGNDSFYGVSLSCLARENEKSSSFSGAGSMLYSLDRPFIKLDGMRLMLSDTQKQIDTVPADGKFEGTVVFTPGCLQEILGALAGNYVSDSVILEGTSQWLDKLGRHVADKRITLKSQPHHPDMVAGQKYTGEGFLAEDYDIIKDGVLENFMLSLYVANKTGHKRAPNSAFAAVMNNGDTTLADILASIDKGLLVGRFSGGAPGANGEFSGVAKNAFLIENGQVTNAVSETMISGNLAGMLNNVRAISKEVFKDGGSVLPYLAVDGITISGK